MSQPQSPYLSVVVTSRNDNHGGSLTRRSQIFINGLARQCQRHKLDAELIIVEWNPPAERVSLHQEMEWPEGLPVRIVTVPKEMHERVAHHDKLPLFQMIAKNVGIRRARGQFVLATNVDLLFNDALCEFLASQSLESGKLYRIDRHDVQAQVPLESSLDEQLDYCRQHIIRLNAREGTFKLDSQGHRRLAERDAAAADSGLVFDAGWFAAQTLAATGRGCRWAGPEATLKVCKAGPSGALGTLTLDCEAGPACRPDARLTILCQGRELLNEPLSGRSLKALDLSAFEAPLELSFEVSGGRERVPRHDRVLSLLVYQASWGKLSAPAQVRRSTEGLLQRLYRALRSLFWSVQEPGEGPIYPLPMHTNACGDFTLLSREDWFKTRGYPELEIFSMHIDSLYLYEAAAYGLEELVLAEPMRIYHIEHGAGWTPEGDKTLFESLDQKGLPYLDYPGFLEYCAQMQATGQPYGFNKDREDWGFAGETLPEVELS